MYTCKFHVTCLLDNQWWIKCCEYQLLVLLAGWLVTLPLYVCSCVCVCVAFKTTTATATLQSGAIKVKPVGNKLLVDKLSAAWRDWISGIG